MWSAATSRAPSTEPGAPPKDANLGTTAAPSAAPVVAATAAATVPGGVVPDPSVLADAMLAGAMLQVNNPELCRHILANHQLAQLEAKRDNVQESLAKMVAERDETMKRVEYLDKAIRGATRLYLAADMEVEQFKQELHAARVLQQQQQQQAVARGILRAHGCEPKAAPALPAPVPMPAGWGAADITNALTSGLANNLQAPMKPGVASQLPRNQ